MYDILDILKYGGSRVGKSVQMMETSKGGLECESPGPHEADESPETEMG